MAPPTATPQACDQRGDEGRLYYNTATPDTPTWVEHIGLVGDLNVSDIEDESELTQRAPDEEMKTYVGDKSDLAISGQQVSDPNYEGYVYMNLSRGNGDPVDWCYLTDEMSVVGSIGWRGMMRNKDRSINNPASGAQTQNFNLRPAACNDYKVRPVRVDVADAIVDYDPNVIPT